MAHVMLEPRHVPMCMQPDAWQAEHGDCPFCAVIAERVTPQDMAIAHGAVCTYLEARAATRRLRAAFDCAAEVALSARKCGSDFSAMEYERDAAAYVPLLNAAWGRARAMEPWPEGSALDVLADAHDGMGRPARTAREVR